MHACRSRTLRDMNLALWAIAAVLALAFLVSGAMKVVRTKQQLLTNPQMGWAEGFSQGAIRAIGALEVLGALGLILPGITGIATFLVGTAAIGLAVVMVGAALAHIRRNEPFILQMMLFVLLAIVAYGRFVSSPF